MSKQQLLAHTNSSAVNSNTANNKNEDNNVVAPENNTSNNNINHWILPILVGVHIFNVVGRNPMTININNNLPCVDFKLGKNNIATSSLRMFVYSDAAMNSSNLNYHRSIMSRFPDVVAEYIDYGPGTKDELVQLKVAVTRSTVERQFNDDRLSAITRYRTPFKKTRNNFYFLFL